MTYNGHANYETWNVCLWVDNEYPLYLKKVRLLDRVTEPITAEDVKGFVDGYMGGITPDVVDPDDMRKVDWVEIAESWETERQEQILYRLGAANQYDTVDEYLSDKAAEIQAKLAPYDLGIDDDEIRELLLDEDGDVEGIVAGYLEDVEPLREDQPVHLGNLVDLDGPVWYAVVWVERGSGRRLAIFKHDTEARALRVAGQWNDDKAERIEVVENPGGKVIWTSDEVTI